MSQIPPKKRPALICLAWLRPGPPTGSVRPAGRRFKPWRSTIASSSEGIGFGQSLLSDATESQPNCDAIVKRGNIDYRFGTFNPAGESDLVRVEMVQAAFEFAQAGDVVTIGPGVYDFGRGGPYLLPPCLVRGSGSGVTIFQSEKLIDGEAATPTTAAIPMGPSFALQDGTVLEDMSLTTTPWNIYEDGGCVGFLPTTTNAHAIVRRCQIQANDWAVYNWSPGNTHGLDRFDSHVRSRLHRRRELWRRPELLDCAMQVDRRRLAEQQYRSYVESREWWRLWRGCSRRRHSIIRLRNRSQGGDTDLAVVYAASLRHH